MISLKLVFRCFKGRLYDNEILLVLVHGCRWTQAASGAAGRANVGLCPASSLISLQPKSRFLNGKVSECQTIRHLEQGQVCSLHACSTFSVPSQVQLWLHLGLLVSTGRHKLINVKCGMNSKLQIWWRWVATGMKCDEILLSRAMRFGQLITVTEKWSHSGHISTNLNDQANILFRKKLFRRSGQ